MAFARRFARGSRRFSGRFARKRRTPFELCQISLARRGLQTGLCSVGVPDQFFNLIVSGRSYTQPYFVNAATAQDPIMFLPRAEKGIVVRGVQFDYYYSVIAAEAEGEGDEAIGITSIRSGLVVLELAPVGSGGDLIEAAPLNPSSNFFFHNETQHRDKDWGGGFNATEQLQKYRIIWRGMEMQPQVILPQGSNFSQQSSDKVPWGHNASRHVRLRTGCMLAPNEGLFWVTETVNPFLTDNPTIGLDLFGTCVVKRAFRGNRYAT